MKLTLKRILMYLLPLLMIIAGQPTHSTVRAAELDFKSRAALLMDYNSGEIAYSLHEHEKLYPASVTKIMTLLLALEALQRTEISLSDEVPVTQNAASMGGSQLFLSPGDVVDMESLLIGIAVGSGNDAAVAVAEYIAGGEKAFVELMNRRAGELNMNNTNFMNPTGLHHPEHYSTAYDIALMGRELLVHDLFFRWSTIWLDENFLEGRIKSGKVYLSNTNPMIRSYRDCDGIKTGWTRDAGYCIAATAKRDDTRFISVILNGPDGDTCYGEAASLLNYAFANYTSVLLKGEGEIVAGLPVEKGTLREVDILTAKAVSFLQKKGDDTNYQMQVVLPHRLQVPLSGGEKVGEILVKSDDKVFKKVDLVAAQDVGEASFKMLLRRYLDVWLTFGRK